MTEEDHVPLLPAILISLAPFVFIGVMVYVHRHGGAAMRRTLRQIRELPEHRRDRSLR